MHFKNGLSQRWKDWTEDIDVEVHNFVKTREFVSSNDRFQATYFVSYYGCFCAKSTEDFIILAILILLHSQITWKRQVTAKGFPKQIISST